jgi:hypothetical protein
LLRLSADFLGAQHRLVVAIPARHVERPHAELAHVAERHRLDRVVESGMTVEDPEAMAGKPSSFPLRNT